MKQPSGPERRTAERIQTHHHVVFSEYRALGPLRTGIASDRSSGGMRIVTAHPEPLGTTLQIELRASADSQSVLLIEGRVVHITPLEKGEHAMGIKLVAPTLRAGTPLPTRERRVLTVPTRPPAAAAMQISSQAMAMPAGMPPDMEMTEAVTFRRIEDGGRPGSWLALLAILALLIILILLVVEAMRERDRMALGDLFDWFTAEKKSTVAVKKKTDPRMTSVLASLDSPDDAGSRGRLPSPVMLKDRRSAGVPQPHRVTGVTLAVGVPAFLDESADAAMFAGAPPELRGAAPLSAARFAAMMDYADRAAARGEPSLARAVVRRAIERAGGVHSAWLNLAGDYQDLLSAQTASAPAYPLSEEVDFADPASGVPTESDVRIEVDASDHLMRVWRGDQPLAEFPVGLGRDGATPSGTFRIGSKARNPDWYHGGRVVPAGDPGNPIGSRWLGLAQDGARTGIGIHPTAQPASIGGNHSLGCVRMRPEDAETLYRLVPLGATVTIHP